MRNRLSGRVILIAQPLIVLAIGLGWWALSPAAENDAKRLIFKTPAELDITIPRDKPLRIESLYDDPSVVSHADLAAVLAKVRPRFDRRRLSPNHVEHALRAWGMDARFKDRRAMSGALMTDFLVDTSKYLSSWGADAEPLLVDDTEVGDGVVVRWGDQPGESVHHDHTLACLTEAGVPLKHPVATATRRTTLEGVLRQGLRDFRIDEREVEWSAMAFGLWLPPHKQWLTGDGRRVSFDLLARRLMRGHCRLGVCVGTHRVYSLMLLWRLNEDHQILSEEVRDEIWAHLLWVKGQIEQSQFADGHWPSNWGDGRSAVTNPIEDPAYRKVIATGHHLEWLAIAPIELHPDREVVRRAARWLIENVKATPQKEVMRKFTFYSHVGNALALWRGTRPAEFWIRWQGDSRSPVVAPKPGS